MAGTRRASSPSARLSVRMADLLERKLIVVTGKGGVGKSTIAAALGILAARGGRRTILVEVGGQRQLPRLLGHGQPPPIGGEVEVADGLWTVTADPERALTDWLAGAAGRLPARFLTSRTSFQYFAAAAPGAGELLNMIKVADLARRSGRRGGYDLVILDAPATGHALAMLASPQTFTTIVRGGPMAAKAHEVQALLDDPQRSGYLAVCQSNELAVSETLELAQSLPAKIGRQLETVAVNCAYSRRFSAAELERLGQLDEDLPAVRNAVSAAYTVNERARLQARQLARLRRAKLPVVSVPFMFEHRLERSALERVADHLARKL